MTGLATTACYRCREQKLKCSRQQPSCSRCIRLSSCCSYPAPPDRKLLASKRSTPRERHRTEAVHPPRVIQKDQGDFTDKTLQSALIDIYFTCTFNAELVLHRQSFEASWRAANVFQPLLQAVCAMATCYVGSQTASVVQGLDSVNDLQAQGQRWADTASQDVLQHIDQPTQSLVQTCMILSLFWSSIGDSTRHSIHAAISLRSTQVLMTRPGDSPVEREMTQRNFWSAWIQSCVNVDHYMVGSSADTRVLHLRLPSSVVATNEEREEPSKTLADPSSQQDRPCSVWAEIIRLVHIWTQIRDHVESRARLSVRQWLPNLFDLDQRIFDWANALPPSLKESKRNLYEHLTLKRSTAYSTMHALSYQCRIVLHASVKTQSGDHYISADLIQNSRNIALSSAQAISQMSASILVMEADPATLSPMFGYYAYSSIVLQVSDVLSGSRKFALSDKLKLEATFQLLQRMSIHWRHIETMWQRVKGLEGQLESGYLTDTSKAVNSVEAQTVSDDVLQYSLQRLMALASIDDLVHSRSSANAEQQPPLPSESASNNAWTDLNTFDGFTWQPYGDFNFDILDSIMANNQDDTMTLAVDQ